MTSAKILLLTSALACVAANVRAQTDSAQPAPEQPASAGSGAQSTTPETPAAAEQPAPVGGEPAPSSDTAAEAPPPAVSRDAPASEEAGPTTPVATEPAPAVIVTTASAGSTRVDDLEAAPTPERPEEHRGLFDDRVTLSGGFVSTLRSDVGYDLFTEDDRFDGSLVSVGLEVLRLPKHFAIAVDLGWAQEQEKSQKLLGGDFKSTYDAHTFTLGIEARRYLTDWLYPHARVWGGVALTRLELKDTAEPRTYREDWQPTALGGAGLGITLRTPQLRIADSRWIPRPSIGVRVEGGYVVGASNDFDLDANDSGTTPIALRESSLGTLDRNGPYVQGTLVLRM